MPESLDQMHKDRLNFAGGLIGAMAYGVHATLYITALTYLWSRRAQDWKWIVYATLVFSVASFGVGGAMQFSEMTYVDAAYVEGSKGPGAYAALNGGVLPVTISRTAFALGCWLQDGLLLYRVWFIFDRSYIAAFLPGLIYFGLVAHTFVLILFITTFKHAISTNVALLMNVVHFCLSISFSIVFTAAIVARLLFMRRKLGSSISNAGMYLSVATMLIESAALYAVVAVVYLVSMATKSPVKDLVMPTLGQLAGIAPLLIILRVAQGRAWTRETAGNLSAIMTTPEFARPRLEKLVVIPGGQREWDGETGVSGLNRSGESFLKPEGKEDM